jgi:hypothetical protein
MALEVFWNAISKNVINTNILLSLAPAARIPLSIRPFPHCSFVLGCLVHHADKAP